MASRKKPAAKASNSPSASARRRAVPTGRPATDPSGPKTTRAPAADRREPPPPKPAGPGLNEFSAAGHKFDAMPDRIDPRDWFYQPRLAPLPDQLINCDGVGEDGILDQGREGACTGFALAGVINFLLRRRNLSRRVSPRMLYEMARKYDEWPGEAYEGSSARGAMKGWVSHGVCPEMLWPADVHGVDNLTPDKIKEARKTPGGAFYRVLHTQVRDMHAALNEVGVLYMTLSVHAGWDNPQPAAKPLIYADNGNLRERDMCVIRPGGRVTGGHAVAIVGYTLDGFIIQNSWGSGWGANGFAILPYDDYLAHATDVWAAQLGVPIDFDLDVDFDSYSPAGLRQKAGAIALETIRPYIIDVANDGRLSDRGRYWTTPSDVQRLFDSTIPDAAAAWPKRRVMLYLHGGLNDEDAAAARVVAFRDRLLANQIYPLHMMWETGAMESIKGIFDDYLGLNNRLAGGVMDWVNKVRVNLDEARDRTFELTVAGAGHALWSQMKQNAERASEPGFADGVTNIVGAALKDAVAKHTAEQHAGWELHVVAHSAGSIFLAHALPTLIGMGVPIKTVQLMAPAITVRRFKDTMLPLIESGKCPHPTMYILSDAGERDDHVGAQALYGKSLLYLVSNAFEDKRETPLLGMERFVRPIKGTGGSVANAGVFDADLAALFSEKVDGLPSLVVAGEGPKDPPGGETISPSVSRSDSHGGFDNDEWTMNSVLSRILGGPPASPFTLQDMKGY